MHKFYKLLICLGLSCGSSFLVSMAQPITGVWKGTLGRQKVEIKIIKSGDSLSGTAYYYSGPGNFRRYRIRGYFDPRSNDAIWWDEALLEDKSRGSFAGDRSTGPMMSMADFNCPGEDLMKLDGNSFFRDEKKKAEGKLNLIKKEGTLFADEWDWVIANYTLGANDPYIIDSISRISAAPLHEKKPLSSDRTPHSGKEPLTGKVSMPRQPDQVDPAPRALAGALTPEQKFASRQKILQQVIPVYGDSVELRFYDNAEIDGDSIALFLNGNLVFKHVMLLEKAYSVKFAVRDLEADNEVVMVAENLGSIPPNTALMIALVGEKRYEAHLYATENSSALIRFIKQDGPKTGPQ